MPPRARDSSDSASLAPAVALDQDDATVNQQSSQQYERILEAIGAFSTRLEALEQRSVPPAQPPEQQRPPFLEPAAGFLSITNQHEGAQQQLRGAERHQAQQPGEQQFEQLERTEHFGGGSPPTHARGEGERAGLCI